ncbi:hypothetical protein GJ744_008618 [Endocarpon pusillum]|uniref:Protein-lysine N-methyltransferase EFM4 n=1 Tax=Endocarpon pusillum TaxID=364733 RepID=A0A8H7AK68_9EURO|nr:hypothetical protein GJ744_008618 [Endocarpon pusillum]
MSPENASTAISSDCPGHLQPSELGTKQYWDHYYEEEFAAIRDEGAEDRDIGRLSTWFEDVNAPQRVLNFLISSEFPFAPCHFLAGTANEAPSILDLGTGNGQTLFQLRLQGGFRGQMTGLDYSKASIQLAQELGKNQQDCQDIRFEVMDIISDEPKEQEWWPEDGFDLVLDKGTFDAISLSEDVVESSTSNLSQTHQASVRLHTLYPSRALSMVKPGGFLLVTSCNWTQEELIHWFTGGATGSSHSASVWKCIEYPKFKFGGQEGQGACTVCFRKALSFE